jgi:mono/diheme cytochrome c family protein
MEERFQMRNAPRRRVAALTLRVLGPALLVGLAACHPPEEGGYPKQTHRTQIYLPEPATPAPPPYRAPAAAAAGAQVVAASLPEGVTQEMVDVGQRLYGTVCVACHGAAGTGSAAGPSLNDGQWIHISGSYDEILNIIHVGVPRPAQFAGAMPPKGGGNFDEAQMRALAAYVYALSHPAGS